MEAGLKRPIAGHRPDGWRMLVAVYLNEEKDLFGRSLPLQLNPVFQAVKGLSWSRWAEKWAVRQGGVKDGAILNAL